MRPFGLGALLLTTSVALGQATDIAKQVYNSSQDSVFVIYLNDDTGAPKAFGSAFVVAVHTLITNAHVIDAGNPVLAVGPVRIPLRVLRVDQKNDLAILSVDADLGGKALQLASEEVQPGEQIFAIGNPEGLEKTISQGIVSGLRKRGDRDLIQITSPISHGSSGGPILNSKGQVIGVAVGMLDDGQNLNFAVPVAYVKLLLENKLSTASASSVDDSLKQAHEIFQELQNTEYSNEDRSKYQQTTEKLLDLMRSITDSTSREDALTEMACMGTNGIQLSDVGIVAAQKLMREKPSTKHRALLSYVLYDRAKDESYKSLLAEKDSPAQLQANIAHDQFESDAYHEAAETSKTAKGQDLLLASYILGDTKNDNKEYMLAIALHSPVATAKLQVCGVDLTEKALRDLIDESANANRAEEAESWFRRFASQYTPSPFDWDSEGDRRSSANDFATSAEAYEKAADGYAYYGYDYCYAVIQHSLQGVDGQDGVLTDGRKCVGASVKATTKTAQSYFESTLPTVYRSMAETLNGRGVYQSALEYIKEALAAKPDDPFSLDVESKILENLERYSECIAASQAAIRNSDGRYPWMNFQLGQCYFATENWTQAAASYRIAAEADKNDPASAFNLGLSLLRQGYGADARQWFREALNRKPDDELRAKILSALK
jgi:hypothetical protein